RACRRAVRRPVGRGAGGRGRPPARAARLPQDGHQDQRVGHPPAGRQHPDDPGGRQAAVPRHPADAGRRDGADRRADHPAAAGPGGEARDPREAGVAGRRLPVRERRPVPDEHLPQPRAVRAGHAADRDQDPEVRGPGPAAAAREVRRVPPRDRDRVRDDRVGQVDHAGGRHRADQPDPVRADHHGRGPDRVPARERDVARQPGRGRGRQRELRLRPAGHDAAGPGRAADRRDPRPQLDDDRPAGGRHGPPGVHDRPRDERPDDDRAVRVAVRREPEGAAADAARAEPERGRVPAAGQEAGRQGPGAGRRDHDGHPDRPEVHHRGRVREAQRGGRQPRVREPELRPAPDRAVQQADHRRQRGQAAGEQRRRPEPGPPRDQQQRHEAAV
ncbi:MAG: Twitching motility protein PilT, partial [uncultured Phycisphaerae bacterium]